MRNFLQSLLALILTCGISTWAWSADYVWTGAGGDSVYGNAENWKVGDASNGFYPQGDGDTATIGVDQGEITWSSATSQYGVTWAIAIDSGSSVKCTSGGDLWVREITLNGSGQFKAEAAGDFGIKCDVTVDYGEIDVANHGVLSMATTTGAFWGNGKTITFKGTLRSEMLTEDSGEIVLATFQNPTGGLTLNLNGLTVDAPESVLYSYFVKTETDGTRKLCLSYQKAAASPTRLWTWDGTNGTAVSGETTELGAQAYTVSSVFDLTESSIPAKSFTLSFWAKAHGNPWKCYTGFADSSAALQFQRTGSESGLLVYSGANCSVSQTSGSQDIGLSSNELKLLTIVHYCGSVKVYVNGEEKVVYAITNWANLTADGTTMPYFALGEAPKIDGTATGNRNCSPTIADCRIYNTALTAKQVSDLFYKEGRVARTVDANGDWSSSAAWSDGADAPAADSHVTVETEATATLEVNAAADLASLTVVAEGNQVLTLAEDAENTTATFATDKTVLYGDLTVTKSGATLGATTIEAGKTLKLPAGNDTIGTMTTSLGGAGKLEIDATEAAAAITLDDTSLDRVQAFPGIVVLKGTNAKGVTLAYGDSEASRFGANLEVASGHHTFKFGGGGINNGYGTFASGDSEGNPTIRIKDGATLDFYGKDLGGWNNSGVGTDAIIRVEKGGKLNFKQQTSGATFYFHNRLLMDAGSAVTIADMGNNFRINGGVATETTAQLTVPAVAPDADKKQVTISDGQITLPTNVAKGMGISVGANAELTISSVIANCDSSDSPIAKHGAGTLVLTGVNTYPGATTVNAGTLKLSGAGALGTSAVTVNENGTLEIETAADREVTNAISGAGAIRKSGAGTLKLPNLAVTGAIDIAAGAFEVAVDGAKTIGNAITGTGTLKVTGSGVLTLTNAAAFAGTIEVASGVTLVIPAEASVAEGATLLPNATVELAAGAQVILGGAATGKPFKVAPNANGTLTLAALTDEDKTTAAALRLREIMPKGDEQNLDPNGLESGWVELVNESDKWVDLADYRFIRINRSKEVKEKGFGNFPTCLIPPGGRFVFYTSEMYPNGKGWVEDDEKVGLFGTKDPDGAVPKFYGSWTVGSTTIDLGNILVWPDKVNPKKHPFVRLYHAPKDSEMTIVDTVVVPSDLPENASIVVEDAADDASTFRWYDTDPTPGFANHTAPSDGSRRLGPNVGPLHAFNYTKAYKDDYAESEFQYTNFTPMATAGSAYTVTLPINPVMNPQGGDVREEDAITSVKLIYRKGFGTATAVNPIVEDEENMTRTATAARDAAGYATDNWGDVYTATIPADFITAADKGKLIQWKVQITDAAGSTWTSPSFNNKDDGYEWYGTIVADESLESAGGLPTWHMFADANSLEEMDKDNPDQDLTKVPNNARVAIYDSSTETYYDYVRIDLRGNTSADFDKKSHGLRFAKTHPMMMTDFITGEPLETEVRKSSLISEYADPSWMRQMVAFWTFKEMGNKVPFDFPVRCNLNGEFYQLAFHSERFSDELLEDLYGLDKFGYGYKNVGTLKSNTGTSAGSIEKKLPDDGNEDDLTILQTHLRQYLYDRNAESDNTTEHAELSKFVVQKFDLPAWLNYIASSKITHETDDVWANICAYYDHAIMKDGTTRGTGTWMPLAYDFNLSFGQYYYGNAQEHPDTYLMADEDWFKSHPFYGGNHVRCYTSSTSTTSPGEGNSAYEAIFQNEKFRRLYLRRLRTLMDAHLGAPQDLTNMTDAELLIEQKKVPFMAKMLELVEKMREDSELDQEAWPNNTTDNDVDVWQAGTRPANIDDGIQDIWDNYVVPRRIHLYETHSVTNTTKGVGYAVNLSAGIPAAQSAIANLAEGISATYNADLGAVVIQNTNAETIDLSGWKLVGPVNMTLPAGTVIDQGETGAPGEVYVTADRRATIAALGDDVTNQVVVGNGTAGEADTPIDLKAADGSSVCFDANTITFTEKYSGGAWGELTWDNPYDSTKPVIVSVEEDVSASVSLTEATTVTALTVKGKGSLTFTGALTVSGTTTIAAKATFAVPATSALGTLAIDATARIAYVGLTNVSTTTDTEKYLQLPHCTDNFAYTVVYQDSAIAQTDATFALGGRGGSTQSQKYEIAGGSIQVGAFILGNGGSSNNHSKQQILQRSGDIKVTGTTLDNTASSVLFAHWPNDVSYSLEGGSFTAAAPVRFGWDGTIALTVGGGDSAATFTTPGFQVGGDRAHAASLTVAKNGIVVLAKDETYNYNGTAGLGMLFANSANASLELAGGTIRAGMDATISANAGKATITADSALEAAPDTTLTVSAPLAGDDKLIIGSATQTGTVKLTGDLSGFTGTIEVKGGVLDLTELTGDRPAITTIAERATVKLVPTAAEMSAQKVYLAPVGTTGTSYAGSVQIGDKTYSAAATITLEIPFVAKETVYLLDVGVSTNQTAGLWANYSDGNNVNVGPITFPSQNGITLEITTIGNGGKYWTDPPSTNTFATGDKDTVTPIEEMAQGLGLTEVPASAYQDVQNAGNGGDYSATFALSGLDPTTAYTLYYIGKKNNDDSFAMVADTFYANEGAQLKTAIHSATAWTVKANLTDTCGATTAGDLFLVSLSDFTAKDTATPVKFTVKGKVSIGAFALVANRTQKSVVDGTAAAPTAWSTLVKDEATEATFFAYDGAEQAYLTMDEAGSVETLTVLRSTAELVFVGTNTLTVTGATTIKADTDLSAITATLGTVKVAAGVTLTLGANTTITTLDLSEGGLLAFAGSAAGSASVGTLVLGEHRDFMGEATADKLTVTSKVTLQEGRTENDVIPVTWTMGESATIEVTDLNGTTRSSGTEGSGVAVEAGDATGSYEIHYPTTLTGNGAWYEFNFDGNLSNSGYTKTTYANMEKGNNVTLSYTANTNVYADNQAQVLQENKGSWITAGNIQYPTESDWAATIYAKMPTAQGAVMVGFGGNRNTTKGAIALVRGDETTNEALLVHVPPSNVNTPFKVLARMTVPNATSAYHLYTFVRRYNADATKAALEVYLDETPWATYHGAVEVDNGLQVGSILDGFASNWVGNVGRFTNGSVTLTGATDGAIDLLRVYDCELSEREVPRIIAEGYDYESPDGAYERTLTDADFSDDTATWKADVTWTHGTDKVAEPPAGEVTLTNNSTNSAISVNASADTKIESLKLTGNNMVFAANKTTEGTTWTTVSVEGLTTVDANVTLDTDAFNISGGPVIVTTGHTLTINVSDATITALVYEALKTGATASQNLTGRLVNTTKDQVTISMPTFSNPEWTIACDYSEDTECYTLTAQHNPWFVEVNGSSVTWKVLVPGNEEPQPLDRGEGLSAVPLNLAGAAVTVEVAGEGALTLPGGTTPSVTVQAADAAVDPSLALTFTTTTTAADGVDALVATTVDTLAVGAGVEVTLDATDETVWPKVIPTVTIGDNATLVAKRSQFTAVSGTGTLYLTAGTLEYANSQNGLSFKVAKDAVLEIVNTTMPDGVVPLLTLEGGATFRVRNGYNGGGTIATPIVIDASATLANPAKIDGSHQGGTANLSKPITLNGVLELCSGYENEYTISGAIAGAGTLIMSDTQSISLSNANNAITGAVIVKTSGLSVTSLGTCDVTVDSGATLTGALSIAEGKTLAGGGTITGAVTFANGAILDAVGLTVTGGVSVPSGAAIVKGVAGSDAVKVLAVGSDQTLSADGFTAPAGLSLTVADTTEDPVVPALWLYNPVTIAKPTGATDDYSAQTQTVIAEATAAANANKGEEDPKVTAITAVEIVTAGAETPVADAETMKTANLLGEIFENVVTVTPNSEGSTEGTATIAYDFGVERFTIKPLDLEGSDIFASGNYLILKAKVEGKVTGKAADFAKGAKVEVTYGDDNAALGAEDYFELADGDVEVVFGEEAETGAKYFAIKLGVLTAPKSGAASTTHRFKVKARK